MSQLATLRQLWIPALLIFGNSALALAQTDSIYRLPVGTRIRMSMDVELSSRVASRNDTFTATVAAPILRRDIVVLPQGAIVEGRVTSSAPAASGSQDGKIEVVFESLRLEGLPARKIDAQLVDAVRTTPSSSVSRVLSVIGGAAAGALIGALSHTSGGALIGAGIGAGAGTALAVAKKGQELRIKKDEIFEIELKKEVVLPVRDY